jgi:hypothetical protein
MTAWLAKRCRDRLGCLALVVTLFAGLGCGSVCNGQNLCSVTGSGSDIRVCDGGDFRLCDDNNRGQTINCTHDNRRAVCTPDGWAFETTP